jgi:hypothetical protein
MLEEKENIVPEVSPEATEVVSPEATEVVDPETTVEETRKNPIENLLKDYDEVNNKIRQLEKNLPPLKGFRLPNEQTKRRYEMEIMLSNYKGIAEGMSHAILTMSGKS